MYEEKRITCLECGKEMIFSVEEQEFYASKGFREAPKRCKECRRMRRTKKIYVTICARCGGEAQVPFLPAQGKPVFCKECYEAN